MTEQNFIQWLMKTQIPSIRYQTMHYLLDLPDTDAEVQAAWESMKTCGPIPSILAEQSESGSWLGEHSYYTPKYTSTHWSMLLLEELDADSRNPHLQRGANFMLQATSKSLERHLESDAHGLTCFWANLLRYALHCGLADDPRLAAIIALLVNDALHVEWRCEHNHEMPCAWGAARTLWALATIPVDQRSLDVQAAIQSGLVFLLEEHDLLKADYPTPLGDSTHPLWYRLNFPLFYQADILFVLRASSELGKLSHPSAQKALEWLQERRSANGQWRSASPFRQRTWKSLGDHQETNRWVSLQAALILKSAGKPI